MCCMCRCCNRKPKNQTQLPVAAQPPVYYYYNAGTTPYYYV